MRRNALKTFLVLIPIIGKIFKLYFDYWEKASYYPGHFYSPIIEFSDLNLNDWENPQKPLAIELEEKYQIELLNKISNNIVPDILAERKTEGKRYYSDNSYFLFTDSIVLQGMISIFKPEKIIEIGSGFSSAAILDLLDFHKEIKTHLTFIEPNPERLFSLLNEQDKLGTTIIENKIQEVPLKLFFSLKENDILFIDSSHVSKTGSDLNFILFQIIPNLKEGVIIHFHDIFYPFEYPLEWVKKGRNWNEDYLIRSFLMYNESFKILFFNDYMHHFHADLMKERIPYKKYSSGGSLWIKKIK